MSQFRSRAHRSLANTRLPLPELWGNIVEQGGSIRELAGAVPELLASEHWDDRLRLWQDSCDSALEGRSPRVRRLMCSQPNAGSGCGALCRIEDARNRKKYYTAVLEGIFESVAEYYFSDESLVRAGGVELRDGEIRMRPDPNIALMSEQSDGTTQTTRLTLRKAMHGKWRTAHSRGSSGRDQFVSLAEMAEDYVLKVMPVFSMWGQEYDVFFTIPVDSDSETAAKRVAMIVEALATDPRVVFEDGLVGSLVFGKDASVVYYQQPYDEYEGDSEDGDLPPSNPLLGPYQDTLQRLIVALALAESMSSIVMQVRIAATVYFGVIND
jgi:hypothetical protein